MSAGLCTEAAVSVVGQIAGLWPYYHWLYIITYYVRSPIVIFESLSVGL